MTPFTVIWVPMQRSRKAKSRPRTLAPTGPMAVTTPVGRAVGEPDQERDGEGRQRHAEIEPDPVGPRNGPVRAEGDRDGDGAGARREGQGQGEERHVGDAVGSIMGRLGMFPCLTSLGCAEQGPGGGGDHETACDPQGTQRHAEEVEDRRPRP